MIKIIKYINDYQSSLDFLEELNKYVIDRKEFNSVTFINKDNKIEKDSKYGFEINYLSEFIQEENINYLIFPVNSYIVGKLSYNYFIRNNKACKQIAKNEENCIKLISASKEYFDRNFYYDINWKDSFDFVYPNPPSYPIINYNDKNPNIFKIQFDIIKNNYFGTDIDKNNFKEIGCCVELNNKNKLYSKKIFEKQLYPNKINIPSSKVNDNHVKLDCNKKYHPMYLFNLKEELILNEKEIFNEEPPQDSNYNFIYFCIFVLIFIIAIMLAYYFY